MHSLADALSHSPELFPHAFDVQHDVLKFVRLSRADYAEASFLDQRILSPARLAIDVPWPDSAAAIDAARLTERCGYIFHIGHVGSTLLSRLVGAHPGVLSLREPLVLRSFAQAGAPSVAHTTLGGQRRTWSDAEFEARLSGCLKMLSRTYHPAQIAIVKATSFVSELAAGLLARVASPRAAVLFVSAESYLATILGGANSRREAKILTPGRVARLQRRTGDDWNGASLSEGEALALGWACEMSGLVQASQAAPAQVITLNFDDFLARPHSLLLATLRHFGIPATAEEVSDILAGPDIRRYSKAPEHDYDAALRTEVLDAARALHGVEIRRGLEWLTRAAGASPVIRDALAFAATAAIMAPGNFQAGARLP